MAEMDGTLSVSCGVGRLAGSEKCVLGKQCIADLIHESKTCILVSHWDCSVCYSDLYIFHSSHS